ncbi:CheR family methyltransferase [Pseudomonas aeruginosa]|nr:CheR family methyltransferase [Pseudomonas aeruginosa]
MQATGVWSLQPLADMSAAEFRDWQVLLENRTGVVLNEQRRTFLQASLTARMRELGIGDYHSYYRQVTDGPRGAVEWATLLDRLTVQETRFFVIPRHRAARTLPGRAPAPRKMPRPWAQWSVGCSSGEEPYSLAMCAAQALRGQEREDFLGVTGTDISLHALQRARQANYPARKLEQLEAGLVERYCERQADGSFSVKTIPDRARLLRPAECAGPGEGALVRHGRDFCQNLLIYFRRWRRRDPQPVGRTAGAGRLAGDRGRRSGRLEPSGAEPVADEAGPGLYP